ncbi:glycoside hydrolase family 28 protein [Gilvimarinus xylanilyticus]|uniref:Glycoside hydrolase family 28 protein n=1 Tax=Gilvimarinus xylanilyticus TaxID=2944139 RepID=A0A9X2KSI2_9GAMM|nr:glycoside hydrolase family 28 protein [Gilvimarinus xylanilyticus]MCP8898274.1 glycoside hydrolase family 28 protein [Gilvimarinus xylanilyticus]
MSDKPLPPVAVNRRAFLHGALSMAALAGCTSTALVKKQAMPMEEINVSAPFAMPTLRIPDFSGRPSYRITDFGARPDDKVVNGKAIHRAIALASENGGGTVVIPRGEWLTGKIHLQSHVNLHLEEGAVLLFSEDPADYLPAVKTTWEGMECYNYSPLIYAYGCDNIAITGKGTLKARLDVWEVWYGRPEPHMDALAELYHMAAKGVPVQERQMAYEGANLRPHFVQFNRCRHVLVEGISIENSPFWVLHPFLSKDVVIRGVSVHAHGHNNDGVDPEMTQNMLIENCTFDQGDDAIAVKSGRNQDAWRLNRPAKNIVMRHCRIKQAHQLLAVGSELSGGVENILVEHCQFDDGTEYAGTGNLVFIKTNERRGGFVRNITVRDVTAVALEGGALSIATDVLYQWRDLVPTYERRLTPIEGITLENIRIEQARYLCKINGQQALPVKDVTLNNVRADQLKEAAIQNTHVVPFQHR